MTEHNQSTSLPHAALRLTGVSFCCQFLYFLYQVALSHITVNLKGWAGVHMVLPIYYTLLAFLTSGSPGASQTMLQYQSRTVQRPNIISRLTPLPLHILTSCW